MTHCISLKFVCIATVYVATYMHTYVGTYNTDLYCSYFYKKHVLCFVYRLIRRIEKTA